MKNLMRTTAMKTVCFLLCILMLGVAVLSTAGAILIAKLDLYTKSEEAAIRDVQYDLLASEADDIARNIYADYRSYESRRYCRENTNIRYLVTDNRADYIDSNLDTTPSHNDPCWQYQFVEEVVAYQFVEGVAGQSAYGHLVTPVIYHIHVYLEEGLPVLDRYAAATWVVQFLYALRYWIYAIILWSAVISALCYASLLRTAGRQPGSASLHPGHLHKIPFDLLMALNLGAWLFAAWFVDGLRFGYEEGVYEVGLLLLCLLAACSFIGLSISLSVRIKAQMLLQNTLVYKAWSMLKKGLKHLGHRAKKLLPLIRSLPVLWKVAGVLVLWIGVDFLLMVMAFSGLDIAVLFWLLKNAALLVAGLYWGYFTHKLRQGSAALAQGDLDFRVDTSGMYWDFKQHGEDLNSISRGMAVAVEQKLRSERMKTELITNVSHDIKTPLTSIINYATLISEEACDHHTHAEYAQVLVRKSEHLKRLLDDLVEASKASTGNLEVSLAPCDAGVLLSQAAGEFEQRCRAAGLELITAQTDQPIHILADSRRIWRVFENLMSNACKYSLPGSRVFIGLKQEENTAVFTFRNVTNTVLNISAEELMERFVRGDTARSTEGSGLGLSIARSLTELQNGKMDITIDGDLFKVTLRFPVTKS